MNVITDLILTFPWTAFKFFDLDMKLAVRNCFFDIDIESNPSSPNRDTFI